jgi:hypothetical protein
MKWSESYEQVGRTISIPVKLIHAIGAKEAIFVSQLFFWQGKQKDDQGWIYKTKLEIEEEIGLTREEQDRCVGYLKTNGLLETRHERLEHKLFYRLNLDLLDQVMEPEGGKLSLGEEENPLSRKCETLFRESVEPSSGIIEQKKTSKEDLHKGGFFEASASKTKKAARKPEQILESMPPNLILSTNPKFKAVFLNWISHGLQLKYPITNPQFEIHWEKCVLMGPEKAIRQIKFSIEHGRNNLDEIQVKSSVNGFQTSRGTKVVLPPL